MDLKNILKAIKLNEGTISMVLGTIVVFAIGILVFNYFRGLRTEVPKPAQVTTTTTALPQEHTVTADESLWKIAEKYYGSGYNWVDIAKENKLANPHRILVAQKLTIPKAEIRVVIAPTVGAAGAITGSSYTVIKGDHLWGISIRAYGDGFQWVKIARENKLRDPNRILVGQVLSLPR